MNGSDTATGILRDEHQLILEVAGVLERALAGNGWEPGDIEVYRLCASFFRLYADACHHAKEEDLLFPELEGLGMPRDGGPIGVMLEEHRIGRGFVAGMHDALDRCESGLPAEAEFRSAAEAYVDLIRAHIGKEDNVLFMMADQMVTGPACRVLCDAYGVACARRFGGKTRDQLEGIAAELTARYPPR